MSRVLHNGRAGEEGVEGGGGAVKRWSDEGGKRSDKGHAPRDRLKTAGVFSPPPISFDGNVFHVRKLKTGAVLEHTL